MHHRRCDSTEEHSEMGETCELNAKHKVIMANNDDIHQLHLLNHLSYQGKVDGFPITKTIRLDIPIIQAIYGNNGVDGSSPTKPCIK